MEKNIHQDAIKHFWQGYLATLPETKRMGKKMPNAWAFGLGSEMADDLGALVASGIKQATASRLWDETQRGLMVRSRDSKFLNHSKSISVIYNITIAHLTINVYLFR